MLRPYCGQQPVLFEDLKNGRSLRAGTVPREDVKKWAEARSQRAQSTVMRNLGFNLCVVENNQPLDGLVKERYSLISDLKKSSL